jgi:general stress protein YciG
MTETNVVKKSKKGFASMSSELQKEIASKGGKAAHKLGSAHVFNKEEAQAAGRKGGLKVSANKEHMSQLGRLGGIARKKKLDEAKKNTI